MLSPSNRHSGASFEIVIPVPRSNRHSGENELARFREAHIREADVMPMLRPDATA
jgi:hypothetical protein